MADYDFHQLSAYDLEILARDLLQAHWGVTIESFKSGKDGGIDLRYAEGKEKLVVQVKHFMRTGLNGLLRELKKEAPKAQKLKPSRYVVVTSVPLSKANKDEIVAIIGKDILAPQDVIGCEDLNNLLGQHSEIESQHFKLWLASKAVLDRVLHNAAMTQSAFKAHQVHQQARRYVQSAAYPQALKMLNEHRMAVIAGPPGVGKTTLADLLLYEHLGQDYQAVLIQRDIQEGKEVFDPNKKQVFYFDDFMGATFLGDTSGGSIGANDRALLDFIAMVRVSPHSRLIVTTREHVYSQAMSRSERLRNSSLDDLRVFLRMPSYSFAQKALILYNHLYFSDLPPSYRDELLKNEFYLKIIKHEKLNPRLIEWLSSFRRVRTIPVANYRQFVEKLLDDPSEIWRHAYEQEISDAARSLLLALFSHGGKAGTGFLEYDFTALHGERARRYGFQTRPEDYRSALREIANSFIKAVGTNLVEVIDPSVLDLLNTVVREAPPNAADIVASATSFSQIQRVWTFAKAEGSSAVRTVLLQDADRLAPAIKARALEDRRFEMGKGLYGYRGPTYEARLDILLEMAERYRGSPYVDLVKPVFERLQQEWATDEPHINDGVEAIRTLETTTALPEAEVAAMKSALLEQILDEASSGCRSDELRELIGVIDTSKEAPPEPLEAARAAFENYKRSYFSEDLSECRSGEQFDGLIEDLELMGKELGVDVKRLVEQVAEAQAEFEENSSEYADDMQDEWKERWRGERETERSVSEMFGSLKAERD